MDVRETKARYLEHLWFVMQHSDDEDGQALVATCYVDESSTDDKVLPYGVLGGVLFEKSHFMAFDPEWSDMLERYRIEPPLHMNEFGQHGKHGHFDRRQRECLLKEAVHLINEYKVISVSTWLGNREWEKHIDPEIREVYSVYAMCFMGMVVRNQYNANANEFSGRTFYVFDEGNSKKHHILRAHAAVRNAEDVRPVPRLGSLTFEFDTFVTALQAADMVAWAKRRKLDGHVFRHGMEPLAELFSEEHHLDTEVTVDILQKLNVALRALAARESDGEAAV